MEDIIKQIILLSISSLLIICILSGIFNPFELIFSLLGLDDYTAPLINEITDYYINCIITDKEDLSTAKWSNLYFRVVDDYKNVYVLEVNRKQYTQYVIGDSIRVLRSVKYGTLRDYEIIDI